jgi:hypothetical protein
MFGSFTEFYFKSGDPPEMLAGGSNIIFSRLDEPPLFSVFFADIPLGRAT